MKPLACSLILATAVAASGAPAALAQPGAGSGAAPTGPAAVADAAAPTGPRLTLAEAVARARKLQPELAVDAAATDAARARVDAARAAVLPSVSASASANASTHTPTAALDPVALLDVGARATWLITDFGQTAARRRAARINLEAAKRQLTTTGLDVATGVETAYLQAMAERDLLGVARTTEASELRHLDEAHRFVAAGAHDPIEEAQARARAAAATSARIRAEGDYLTSIANLRLAIGDPSLPDDVALDDTWPGAVAGEDHDRAELVAQAMARRPELASAQLAIDAASASLDAARRGLRPTISLGASAGWMVSNNTTGDPSWSLGVSLSVPIFDGGLTRAQTREAEANRAAASARRQSQVLAVEADVEAAWIAIRTSRAQLASTAAAVEAAHQQLALAEGRYTQGVGSGVELADAQTAVTSAEGDQVSATLQLATARIRLARALGM